MTVSLWRIGTDTPEYTADDSEGHGAKATGGRWNRVGTAIVYASPTIALACLETLVHVQARALPLNRYVVRIDVPDGVWASRETFVHHPDTVGWDALPTGKVSLDIGDRWLASLSSALLLVPSVIVPMEFNVLINPVHPDSKALTFRKQEKFVYDTRLRTGD